MKKIFLALILILPFSLALTGCVKSNKNKDDDENKKMFAGRNFDNSKMFEKLNLQKIALADLKIGDKISVFGPSNADGSINAEKIILGDLTEMMKTLIPAPTDNSDKNTEIKTPAAENNQLPTDNPNWGGNHPNNFRGEQNGQARTNMPTRQRKQGQGMMNRANRIVGEIIKIENNTITLKLTEGGSKIILINDKTEISKFDPSNITAEKGQLSNEITEKQSQKTEQPPTAEIK